MDLQERVVALKKEVDHSHQAVQALEEHGAFIDMKLAQLENKQKSDMLFFQDQFNLKIQKIRERPLSQQDQFQLQSFFNEAQSSWEKKIANLGTILHKKTRFALKKQAEQRESLSRALQEHHESFQLVLQNTQAIFDQQISKARAMLANKADRGHLGEALVEQKDKLQFLQRSIEFDFQEQRKKVQVVENLIKQTKNTPVQGLAQQQQAMVELQSSIGQMARQIEKNNKDNRIQQMRMEEQGQEQQKIREVEGRRSEIQSRVQEVQRQLVMLNERLRKSQERAEAELQRRVTGPLAQLQRELGS